MIEENKFGFRDKRGHFVPKEAADKNPLWILPVNLKKIFNWFVFSYIFKGRSSIGHMLFNNKL